MRKFVQAVFIAVFCLLSSQMVLLASSPLESALRSKSVMVHYSLTVAANVSTHTVLIHLPDTWPNPSSETGFANISGLTVEVDKAAASTATVKVGVLNTVNPSTGSVSYFYELKNENNVSNTANLPIINTDNAFRCLKANPPTTSGTDGATPFLLTNSTLSGSTIFQTTLTLPSAAGQTKPSAGDVILSVVNGTGSINVVVDVLYFMDSR